MYYFTEEGVFRKSNHWGRVASYRWRLNTKSVYKNQQTILAFAKWEDFYHLNEKEKLFFISINFETKKINIKVQNSDKAIFLFTLGDAQRREKEIKHIFKEVKWAKYFDESIEKLRYKIIMKLINSNLSLQQIKTNIKLGL